MPISDGHVQAPISAPSLLGGQTFSRIPRVDHRWERKLKGAKGLCVFRSGA